MIIYDYTARDTSKHRSDIPMYRCQFCPKKAIYVKVGISPDNLLEDDEWIHYSRDGHDIFVCADHIDKVLCKIEKYKPFKL